MNRYTNESDLIEKLKEGDNQAFRFFVDLYEPTIANIVIAMLGNTPEAEDVAQEVFIRFYKTIRNFRGQSSVKTYISRIAINLSLNELKKRKQHNNRFISKEEFASRIHQGHDEAGNYDLKEVIEVALQKLEKDQRSVFALRMIEGYSTRETAEILKIPQGTVLSRLHRAMETMRKNLKNVINQ